MRLFKSSTSDLAMHRQPGRRVVDRFMRREDGTMTTFALMVFILMVAVAGIAIDIMRYETQRVQLQYTLDRAVLAAAAVTQPLDPVDVVENYFDISGLENYRLNVDVEDGLNFRRVEAYAELEINTFFMHMFGVRVLTSPATGAAEEIVPQLEISLVLDVSGSMRFTDSDGMPQIDRLRPAAQEFISNMLQGERSDTTTISIVPYAGQVNPGATVFNAIGGVRQYVEYDTDGDGDTELVLRDHPRSSCLEFDSGDFTTWYAPQGQSFEQVPHFHNWPIDNATMDWGWCPLEDDVAADRPSSAIQYVSNDAGELNEFIQRMRLHDGTGTHYGMQWGLWMLNPNSNWLVEELVTAGYVNSAFDARPAPFTDDTTRKVIVLMTDGNITTQVRPRFVDRTQDPIFATDEGDIFLNHDEELAHQNNSSECNGNGCRRTESGENTNRNRFYAACDEARSNDIAVFTIAFNASSDAQDEMRYCASTPAHYYNVRGADLEDAFQSIAGAINSLRLIQ